MKINIKQVLKNHRDWLNSKGGQRANLEDANLEGANLEDANLEDANLEGADLRGADLRGADLERANLRGADLERANLLRANLEGANLEDANLEDANLEGAYLRDANLRGAEYGKDITISITPIQILGLRYFVILFDNHIKIGCRLHSINEWDNFTDSEIKRMDEPYSLEFWKENKILIIHAAKNHSSKVERLKNES